jgi:peptide/nickel transport system permease protein
MAQHSALHPGRVLVSRERTPNLQPAPRRSRRSIPIGGWVGIAVIALLVLVALIGPTLIGIDPAKQDLRGRLTAPFWSTGSTDHLLGTDQLGRDILARLAAGARVSLTIGLVATLISGIIGIGLGLAAGAAGGLVDRFVSFLIDVQQTVPFVVVAIGIVTMLGPSLRNVIVVLAATTWVGYARIIRLQTRALRRAPFIEAAKAAGASPFRIAAVHLLPNVIGPAIVVASQQVAAMILYEAALSYLGLGAPSDSITWGGMVADGRETMTSAWWVATLPGIAIALTVLGFNLLGDWLRDLLDPTASNGRARR